MPDLTDDARRIIGEIAQRHGLSPDAVEQMARAVANGGGAMAQFNVPELGGSGQWMLGGMTMVGDMFNHGLQARVSNLCTELSNAMAGTAFFPVPQTLAGAAWWPPEFGMPASVGGQNAARYAYFPQERRIAFDPGNGQPVILLDTLDHRIGGFSQQQSGPGDPFAGVTFSSQFGQFALSSLPRLGEPAEPHAAVPEESAPPAAPPAAAPPAATPPAASPLAASPPEPRATASPPAASAGDILATIERLAALRDSGALTEDEFTEKKRDLLGRL